MNTSDRPHKKILFLLQRAPYGSSHAREVIDTIYAASAFDQNVQILFTDDGIWQLLTQQKSEHIARKDVSKLLAALSYYDIDALFVDQHTLNVRQLTIEQLSLPVVALDNQQMRELLRSADSVISL